MISRDREQFIHGQIRAAAERQEIIVHAIGGIADHVHLVVSIPPTITIAEAIHRIKGTSSHAVNQEFGGGFRWQPHYNVDSFSERHLDRVVDYANNQHRHHAVDQLWGTIEPPTDIH